MENNKQKKLKEIESKLKKLIPPTAILGIENAYGPEMSKEVRDLLKEKRELEK